MVGASGAAWVLAFVATVGCIGGCTMILGATDVPGTASGSGDGTTPAEGAGSDAGDGGGRGSGDVDSGVVGYPGTWAHGDAGMVGDPGPWGGANPGGSYGGF